LDVYILVAIAQILTQLDYVDPAYFTQFSCKAEL